MSREMASAVVAGEVVGPHGVGGEVKLKSHLVGNLRLAEGMKVHLRFPDGSRVQKQVRRVRQTARGVLLTFEGVTDRSAAEGLRGVLVEVDASLLPPLGEDEYYWHELIGLEVFSTQSRRLGRVSRLIERPGQDLLVVDVGGREAMIPFVEPLVVGVDLESGRIVIDLPEGLLELAG